MHIRARWLPVRHEPHRELPQLSAKHSWLVAEDDKDEDWPDEDWRADEWIEDARAGADWPRGNSDAEIAPRCLDAQG
jgi:hypothetical protein